MNYADSDDNSLSEDNENALRRRNVEENDEFNADQDLSMELDKADEEDLKLDE